MKKHFLLQISLVLVFFFIQISAQSQNLPIVGEIIISEFMANPSVVSDAKGEWIELTNLSNSDLKLNGLIIKDLGSNKHTISSDDDLIIKAGGFFLMAKNGILDENGGLEPDYIYSNFTLGNSEDEIILCLANDSLLDAVHYNSDWPLYAGASLELNPAVSEPEANNSPSQWHPAVDSYGDGDLGTPGLSNSISNGIYNYEDIEYFEAFPNPTNGELFVRLSTSSTEKLSIHLINVLGQRIPVLDDIQSQAVMIPLDLTGMEKGLYWIEAMVGRQRYIQKLIIL